MTHTTLSLHFPGGPGLAGIRMSPLCRRIGAKGDEGDCDNWIYKSCKAAVKSSPLTK